MEWELASTVTMILAGMAAALSSANNGRAMRVPVRCKGTGAFRGSAPKEPAA
jgi:hypothetical protein